VDVTGSNGFVGVLGRTTSLLRYDLVVAAIPSALVVGRLASLSPRVVLVAASVVAALATRRFATRPGCQRSGSSDADTPHRPSVSVRGRYRRALMTVGRD